MEPISADFNYYIHESRCPMEDGVLCCPFDNPSCLEKNLTSNGLGTHRYPLHNGRNSSEPPLYYDDFTLLDTATSMQLLDSTGLFCVKHSSKMENYWSEEEIVTTYYEELKELTLLLTKADCVAVAAHALRLQGDQQGERLSTTKPLARDAAFTVHNDFSDELRQQFLDMYQADIKSIVSQDVSEGGLGLTEEELRSGRLMVVNYWRPITKVPLERNPLAVLDASSIGNDDIVLCRHPAKKENDSFLKYYKLPIPFINTLIRPNPSHKWYYFPNMTQDELLVFKNYDSAASAPSNGVGMHSSFHDPTTPSSAPPRESIESRVICFFKNYK